ncbi:MAG: 3-oxoacyl-ACP reductase [Thermoleophilaceae bacterium]
MSDRYQQFTESPPGRFLARQLGMPRPASLRRYESGQSLLAGPALLGAAPRGRLTGAVASVLRSAAAEAHVPKQGEVRDAALEAGLDTQVSPPQDDDRRYGAIVFDATGVRSSEQLQAVYEFFHPVMRRFTDSGRLLILGTPPDSCADAREATAQRALEGFLRSAAKELSGGATGQIVYAEPGAEGNLESTLRFLLSAKSAYVDGQPVFVGAGESATPSDWERPLDGKVAVVTGASRGIGEAIAEVLARDGAHVVALDVPAQGDALAEVANRLGGEALQLDITSSDAPRELSDHLRERHGGVDIVVHNAGITRDKTLGRMSEDQWASVIAVNLTSQERLNEELLSRDVLRPGGRIVSVSSQSGIAGNRGQVNYATSKAGLIGMVHAMAPQLAERGGTINAVAPGFIETQMTASMPVVTREAGRRMNSLAQGGLPVDVAETIAWLASPASGGVNGNVVRVCGQSLLGA